jgi:hypothetical protein
MAKRIPRSEPANVPGAPSEPPRKTRVARGRGSREVASEMATGQDQAAAMSDEFVGVAHAGEEPVQAGRRRSTKLSSVVSVPSDEDIRLRAYQRYLERGGGHGMDFEDWLEAERELKTQA